MAQEYDMYLHLHELQPPHHQQPPTPQQNFFNHFTMPPLGPSTSAAPPPYELTTGGERGGGGGGGGGSVDGGNSGIVIVSAGDCSDAGSASLPHHNDQHTRKRKLHHFSGSSTYDGDDEEDSQSLSSRTTMSDKKQNHSEIEKRRRDKMNTYITELSAMVPMCRAMARKLDKLTVLRMAVQHLRSVRGALTAGPLTARPRPAFLSERELNALILNAAHDCFLMVVGCDRGRLLYVSASVSKMLHYDRAELVGQSLFDLLHPNDVAKVKEQLSSSDLSPRERLIDAKTMLPVKTDMVSGASRLCPGARRSFFCRVKCRAEDCLEVKEEADPAAKIRKKQGQEKKYCVVQCTGYLKSWAPAEISEAGIPSTSTSETGNDIGDEGDACNLSCLVAVARALPDLTPAPAPSTINPEPNTRCLQYVSRHATDGKFIFVDQRVTLALGFLPQELLGTSLYEYVTGPELGCVAQAHKAAFLRRASIHTPPYPFRRKDGTFARIQTHFKLFHNPWTKDVECLVANNTLLTSSSQVPTEEDQAVYDVYKHDPSASTPCVQVSGEPFGPVSDLSMQRLIDSQVESHKIGSAIAEDVLRRASPEFSPDLSVDLLHDAVFNQTAQPCLMESLLSGDSSGYNQVRNNVPLSSVGAADSPPPGVSDQVMGSAANSPPPGVNDQVMGSAANSPPPASPPLPSLSLDGNGEAAMAVIMSLLEADAGLGGPVNLSGLPWLLP